MAETESCTPKKRRTRKNRVRDWRPVFLQWLAQTGNVTEACRKARVGRTEVYAAQRAEPGFKADWKDALEVACDALEAEARRRAVHGCDEGVFYKGQKVSKLLKFSDTLLIFLLKAHRPEKFRENVRVENLTIDPARLSDAQLEAYSAGVPLEQVLAMGTAAPGSTGAASEQGETVH